MDNHFPIRKVIDDLGITPAELSCALGMNIAHVSKALSGATSNIPNALRTFLVDIGVDIKALEKEIACWRNEKRKELLIKRQKI